MASSGNFCVLNYLPYSTSFRSNLSKGYLFSNPGNNCTGFGTMALTTGKKWYMEGIAQNAYNTTMGIFEINDAGMIQNSLNTSYYADTSYKSAFYHRDGTKYVDGSNSSYGASFTTNDVIGMAVDLESATNTITFYKNNSSQGSFNLGTNGLDYLFCMSRGTSGGGWHMNFGQDSTFGGTKTAGGNADANGFGDFLYSVPSGHLAVCSANLGIDSDIDPAQTDDDYPSKQFNVITFTGTGSSRTISGLGLQPDLIWAKRRDGSRRNYIVDSNRGFTKYLHSDGAFSEGTSSDGVTSANSDGFVIGGSLDYINTSSNTYVAWCWRANGGTTVSDSNGSTTSTVQANTAAGFSIITYSGSGSNATIGHGLSAKPDFILVKRRSSEQNWAVYHDALGATKNLILNTNAAEATGSAWWQDTEPTNSVIYIGTEGRVNASGQTYVAYAWHNVSGMQHFGSYKGNANEDGPFIYTGFRPRLVFMKNATTGSRYWAVLDSERSTFNEMDALLNWDQEIAEYISGARGIDFLSNGFKIRGNDSDINQSGNTIIYGAWGDIPFKYNNAF